MKSISIVIFLILSHWALAGDLPADRVVDNEELVSFLQDDVYKQISSGREVTESDLARYFRQKFSERYFYDYQTLNDRLAHYSKVFANQEDHKERALDHMGKYNDSTQWILPFNYLNGEPVNAYAMRHLARQHKMVDIALYYFASGRDPKYITYFTNQVRSLNAALHKDEYETIEDGNGVYEAFRSGYRILNWLTVHNLFLGEEYYTDEDQLTTIATLLQHGSHLYANNEQFHPGNHQTRGMSALAMLAILLKDFEGTQKWYDRAMDRLAEHLDEEVNADGFQSERSVHYHMSDIGNYYYVYQLANKVGFEVSEVWEQKLYSLFETLVKIAYPDGSAPVLQDDTEIPWGEKNDISGTMTLGYLLFDEPTFGYFANDQVAERMYWFIGQSQLNQLEQIQKKAPEYGSLSFPETGYFVMREGWDNDDKMMVISAGLDEEKPDHQHGDMLGIQAMAYGKVLLPNYQVRYSLTDFDLFKNSLVKNVALVDEELQGKDWRSNRGGSGFGKFGDLPQPNVIAWETTPHFDLFIGSHDGFERNGVQYTRQVIYVKDDFWIVKDQFLSEAPHDYKQVWQGHYTTEEGPGLIRATYDDASGVDIFQLSEVDNVHMDGTRGKEWAIVGALEKGNYDFLTLIFPYKGYSNRLNEEEITQIGKWKINHPKWQVEGEGATYLGQDAEGFFFGISALSRDKLKITLDNPSDLYVRYDDGQTELYAMGSSSVMMKVMTSSGEKKSYNIKPGEKLRLFESK